MPMDWPWTKRIRVICPDGSTQFVFKNVDHAFPFYFGQAKISAAAAVDGMKAVKGKIDTKYESTIKHILVSIDEKNGSVQAHLRAAYVLYASAPCKKLDYLQAAIEAVRQDEQDLRRAEMAIRQLVALLSAKPSATQLAPEISARISEQLAMVITALSRSSPVVAMVEQMTRIESNTDAWRNT